MNRNVTIRYLTVEIGRLNIIRPKNREASLFLEVLDKEKINALKIKLLYEYILIIKKVISKIEIIDKDNMILSTGIVSKKKAFTCILTTNAS